MPLVRRRVWHAEKHRPGTVRVEIGRLLWPEAVDRPRIRADCPDTSAAPCPFVGCKWNTYLWVKPSGALIFERPDLEPWEVPAESSCTLDVIARGSADPKQLGLTLEEVGTVLNVTRERIRQIEAAALAKVYAALEDELDQGVADIDELREFLRPEPSMVRQRASEDGRRLLTAASVDA